MIFRETDIAGMFLVELEPHKDDRGFFARTYCAEEFERHGLNTRWVQCNLSHSDHTGTLRGIHYQAPPESEIKLVRVARGQIFAVIVDLRPGKGFGRHITRTLADTDGTMLYIPAGCGFGFQTLADDSQLFYQMSAPFRPDLARGVRWDDPALRIRWPFPPRHLSARDTDLPSLRDAAPVPAG